MNAGFTLIELVVVIAIVAVTTSLLLPRVWDWQREARVGNLIYVRGALHSSAVLVHAALLARGGQPDGVPCPGGGGIADNRLEGPGTLCSETGLVHTQHGYPSADETARGAPVGFTVLIEGPVATVARSDAPRPAECRFTYSEPLAARTAASMSLPVVTGC